MIGVVPTMLNLDSKTVKSMWSLAVVMMYDSEWLSIYVSLPHVYLFAVYTLWELCLTNLDRILAGRQLPSGLLPAHLMADLTPGAFFKHIQPFIQPANPDPLPNPVPWASGSEYSSPLFFTKQSLQALFSFVVFKVL